MTAAYNTSANQLSAIRSGVAVVPSNATVIPFTRALWVGVAGTVAVRHADGTTPTYTGVPIGLFLVECDQVLSTGTTATTIIACY